MTAPVASWTHLNVPGKRVLVRVDINCPVKDGRLTATQRIEGAVDCLKPLVQAGAGLVVLAHQGRPGDDDFIGMDQHAAELERHLGRPVRHVPNVAEAAAEAAARQTRPGEVLLLGNVRAAPGELDKSTPDDHAKRPWVRALAAACDAFVFDAFSVAHRGNASVVAFPRLLPSGAGPLMDREIRALDRVHDIDGERVLVVGGAKVDDALRILRHHLEEGLTDDVLTGGLVGELVLLARGNDLGAPTRALLEKTGAIAFLGEVEAVLEQYDPAIHAPVDVVAAEDGRSVTRWIEGLPAQGPVLDIGPATVESYGGILADAGAIICNGPMGAYDKGHTQGTRGILEAIAGSPGFTLLGGGHTVAAIDAFGIPRARFGHVSLAGGALMTALTGGAMPGIDALRESASKFGLVQHA